MAVDPAYGNSSGYFRDPVSGEDLSADTPRVIPCSFENGKFTWPCVMRSDGEALLKITYKLFTEEEKDLYKAYRGGSSSGARVPRKQKDPNIVSMTKREAKNVVPVAERSLVRHDNESAMIDKTAEVLVECDTLVALVQVSGLTYALVTKKDSNVVHYIPRKLIPDDVFNRIKGED